MTRHRWGNKQVFPHKTEQACTKGCGIIKVSHRQHEGGRPIYWTEYWRGLDRIEGNGAPMCEAIEVTA